MSLVVGGDNIVLGTEETDQDNTGTAESDLSAPAVGETLVAPEDPEEESELVVDPGIELYSIGGTYDGSISTSYLAYFAGIADKLTYDQHYVLWRPDRYNYTFAYGPDIVLNGDYFSGSCDYVNIDTYNGTAVTTGSDTLSLSSSTAMVYSDLGMYPEVMTGGRGIEGKTVLFILALMVCYNILHDIFDYAMSLYKR